MLIVLGISLSLSPPLHPSSIIHHPPSIIHHPLRMSTPCYRSILVPVDGSPLSKKALLEACRLIAATNDTNITINILIVQPGVSYTTLLPIALFDPSCDSQQYVVEREQELSLLAKETLDDAVSIVCAELLRLAGERSDTMVVQPIFKPCDGQRIGDVILATAEDNHVDLIVMGTHGRQGLSRQLHGSVTEHVLRSAMMPVLAVTMHET